MLVMLVYQRVLKPTISNNTHHNHPKHSKTTSRCPLQLNHTQGLFVRKLSPQRSTQIQFLYVWLRQLSKLRADCPISKVGLNWNDSNYTVFVYGFAWEGNPKSQVLSSLWSCRMLDGEKKHKSLGAVPKHHVSKKISIMVGLYPHFRPTQWMLSSCHPHYIDDILDTMDIKWDPNKNWRTFSPGYERWICRDDIFPHNFASDFSIYDWGLLHPPPNCSLFQTEPLKIPLSHVIILVALLVTVVDRLP